MWNKFKQTGLVAVLALMLGVGIGFGTAAPLNTVHSQTAVSDSETDLLRNLYTKANPSVVSIDVRLPTTAAGSLFGQQDQGGQPGSPNQQNAQPYQYAAGSGFMYDNAGHIVTNAHVVQGADRVELTFSDDTMMYAKVVGIDPDSDLAVLQAEGNTSKYAPLPIADSEAVEVGDRAIAIGNPFQRSGTMTQGIVSGIHRSVDGLAPAGQNQSYTIPDAIQTDAALNPGNSGGPLLNNQGQVIGVNEQIASSVRQSSGVSFAIPSNLVKTTAEALIKDGKVEHSWLGISGNSLTLDENTALKLPDDTRGAYVLAVQQGSPAAQAGLKGGASARNIQNTDIPTGGDIIVAVDKQPVKHFDDLTSYLFTKTKVGQTITLTVLRNGKQQDLQVTLAARPQIQANN
ncbi:MAG: trypsin-like peptidase domain-containing protein [Chloroflexota bacterium]